jgi:hypothetical protein
MADYYQAVINSVFTGVGTAIGLTIHEIIIKPKVIKIHEKIKQIDGMIRR